MTAKEIFEWRKQGRLEEAYQAIRQLYATDKSPYTSHVMFWTAIDILKKRINEGLPDEATKIFLALERLLPNVPDKEGYAKEAFAKCKDLLGGKGIPQSNTDITQTPHQLGIWGEELATAYLREKGYVILERDWHSKHRDIDIIALDGEVTVFIEVKTRRNQHFTAPIMAIDHSKLRNLQLAINHYIKYHRIDTPVRFDVITIVGTLNTPNPEIEHIQDFSLPCLNLRR